MVLSVKHLVLNRGQKKLCVDLSLNIEPGQKWCVIGPNGCGKTTLLLALAGLFSDVSGDIALDEEPLSQLTALKRAAKIGFLEQERGHTFPMSIRQHVLAGCSVRHKPWQTPSMADVQLADNILSSLHLGDSGDKWVHELSGGEKKRVDIATLLMQKPWLFLLDEPNTHLDVAHVMLLMRIVDELAKRGHGICAVMHDLNLASKFFDHFILFAGGEQPIVGSKADVLTKANLEAAFQFPMQQFNVGDDIGWLPADEYADDDNMPAWLDEI